MGQKLICQECKNGVYGYSEPEREDWENREMTCKKCCHKSTIKKFTERFEEPDEKICSICGSKTKKGENCLCVIDTMI